MEPELKEFQNALHAAAAKFADELSGIRTNRPTSKLVEDLKVDYFDQTMSVKQLGSITIVPPREIAITVWDKNAVGPVAKAIETSGIGLSANIDGSTIRLNLPALTDERRQELIKLVKSIAEQARIRVRALRDDVNKKAKTLPENQKFTALKKIQDAVDTTNKTIESHLLAKVSEIQS